MTAAGAGFITAAVYDDAADAERPEIESTADMYFMSLSDVRQVIN